MALPVLQQRALSRRHGALGSALFLCVLMLTSIPVRADAFRCGSHVVSEGMSSGEVEQRCGEADLVKTRKEPVYARLSDGSLIKIGSQLTRFWYYDRGINRHVARITLRASLAEKIELLDVADIEALKLE